MSRTFAALERTPYTTASPRQRIVEVIVDSDKAHAVGAPSSGIWSRVFAGVYDPILRIGELAGMRARRRELLEQARGLTLEVGSGTGLNIVHYPDDIEELILSEPGPAMRGRLEKRLRRSGRRAQLLDAPAERLPFADGSIDTVVCTLVLCSVEAPDLALREMARVLSPGGQLLFIEHVRSQSPTLAYWQDRLAEPWRRVVEGCRCNLATVELIAACGLEVDARDDTWRGMPPIIRPLVVGRALQR